MPVTELKRTNDKSNFFYELRLIQIHDFVRMIVAKKLFWREGVAPIRADRFHVFVL